MSKIVRTTLIFILIIYPLMLLHVYAAEDECIDQGCDYYDDTEEAGDAEGELAISDPFESVNRVFFTFNDRLYFWLLKPAAEGYSRVVPGEIRRSVRNFFDNFSYPIRLVNSLLQAKLSRAGRETIRFLLNSTFGMFGMYDVAREEFNISVRDREDFGQTLGVWGIRGGAYLNLPFLGPSNIRDAIGSLGDYLIDPVRLLEPYSLRLSVRMYDKVNRTSLRLGEYEKIKEEAIDPYLAIRDIYIQYRSSRILR